MCEVLMVHNLFLCVVCLGLAQTVHGISIYCIYAVYDRIYAVFPYVPYVRENGITQNYFIGGSFCSS